MVKKFLAHLRTQNWAVVCIAPDVPESALVGIAVSPELEVVRGLQTKMY